MITAHWGQFRARAFEQIKATNLPSDAEKILVYIEDPHFDLHAFSLVCFWLEGEVKIKAVEWDKSRHLSQLQKMHLINGEPDLVIKPIFCSKTLTQSLLSLVQKMRSKHATGWKKEGIWLDGIHREVEIYASTEEPIYVKWNISSNNEELNEFSTLVEEIKRLLE